MRMMYGKTFEEACLLMNFKQAYMEKKGTEFENWFADLAGQAYGTDFVKVRNFGSSGDFKCDGRRNSTGTIFQCYAPDGIKIPATKKKIDTDFSGALNHWSDFMKVWAFVHNDYRGLPPEVVQHLDSKTIDSPKIKIEIWGDQQLLRLFCELPTDSKRILYGPIIVPSTANEMTLEDLKPVIEKLVCNGIENDDSPLSIPTAEKLEKNGLSDHVKILINAGRLRERLVKKYFQEGAFVELGERVAKSFRSAYLECKAEGMTPDQIFWHMQRFAGCHGEPSHQIAGLTVLAYFFERCDIFEDPDGKEPDQ